MATGLPTLLQIQAWDVDHLIEAAEHWDSTADRWDNVYGQVWQQSLGMDWQGQARDALIDRTTADRAMVTRKCDQLRKASLTARKGAGDISAVQRSVLYKVDDAHQAGFVVGEDLSLTDTQSSCSAAALAARQAQAQALAADIRSRAAQLVAADSEVGAKLTATAGDVGSLTFDEKPIDYDGKLMHVTVDPRTGRSSSSTGNKHQIRHPALGIRAKMSVRRSKTCPKALALTLARFAAKTTCDGSGIGRPKARRNEHRRARIEASRGSCPTERSSGYDQGDNGLTLDFNPSNGPYEKIHVNAARGGVPEIPVSAAGPPAEACAWVACTG